MISNKPRGAGEWRAVLFLVVLMAGAWFAAPVRAQDVGAAGPTPTPEVRAVMPKGAISLRFEAVPFGGERRGFLHLYCIPKARNKNAPMIPDPGHEKDPVTRKDIYPGMALEPSPFFLDIWGAGSGAAKMTRLHAFRFQEEGDVAQVEKRWLRPATKTGPVLLLDFGSTHWHAWYVFTFPNGFNGKTSYLQRFLWGGEGETYLTQKFTKADKRGFLQIDQEQQDSEAQGATRSTYFWDGARYSDPQERWFVIVATSKTRAEADDFARTRDKYGETEIVRSNRFSRLKPGLWVTVAARMRTKKEADEQAKDLGTRAEFKGAYAKKAF